MRYGVSRRGQSAAPPPDATRWNSPDRAGLWNARMVVLLLNGTVASLGWSVPAVKRQCALCKMRRRPSLGLSYRALVANGLGRKGGGFGHSDQHMVMRLMRQGLASLGKTWQAIIYGAYEQLRPTASARAAC